MYELFDWLFARFDNEDDYYDFIGTVERHKDFPGFLTSNDVFESYIHDMNLELFAHRQLILKLEGELQKLQEQQKQTNAMNSQKDEQLRVIIALYFGYYSKMIELKIKSEEYSEAAIERYLRTKYPKLKEFDVQEVIEPGAIRLNGHRRTDIAVEHFKPSNL